MQRKLTLATVFGAAVFLAAVLAINAAVRGSAADFPPRAYAPSIAADSSTIAMPAGLPACTVTRVVDGDTIDVAGCTDAGRVRLILVDAPETSGGARCFGKEATAFTSQALLNRTVRLEKDTSEKDSFGRYLRYVWADGDLFNARLVREGFAVLDLFPPDLRYQAVIASAEAEAKAAARGLWPTCGGVGMPATPTPRTPATPAQQTPTPSPSATASPPAGACGPAQAVISALDKSAEVVTISGSGNLTGWRLVSERGNQEFTFPAGFILTGPVQVVSNAPAFAATPTRLWWSEATLWNNSEDDDAFLYSCSGALVSTFEDGN